VSATHSAWASWQDGISVQGSPQFGQSRSVAQPSLVFILVLLLLDGIGYAGEIL
jgi:hypothetical protein